LAVCSLCGVGCGDPTDCFCDPARYWSYHRAAPGDPKYTFSSRGASTTEVRDGDVEGWKWGKGEPPELTTVGKVCKIDEPPARPASSGGGRAVASTTTEPAASGPTTAAPPTTVTPGAPVGAARSAPMVTTTAAPAPVVAAGETGETASPAPTTTTEPAPDEPAQALASTSRQADDGARSGPSPVALALFALLLLGLVGWRWRLRRAHA
jgi:hypothetical protein